MDTKICTDCHRDLPRTKEYYAFTTKGCDIPKISSICKKCVNIRSKKRRIANGDYKGKIKRIEELKKQGLKKCSHCNKILSISLFRKFSVSHCKECERILYHEKYKHNRVYNKKVYQAKTDKKTCTGCNNTYPFTKEYFPIASGDILACQCRECRKKYLSKWRIDSGYSKGIIAKSKQLFKQGLKKCSKCKSIKPLDEFSSSKFHSYGHQNECKKCVNKRSKDYLESGKRFKVDSYYVELLKNKGLEITPENIEIQRLMTEIKRKSFIKYKGMEFSSVLKLYNYAVDNNLTSYCYDNVRRKIKRGYSISEALSCK